MTAESGRVGGPDDAVPGRAGDDASRGPLRRPEEGSEGVAWNDAATVERAGARAKDGWAPWTPRNPFEATPGAPSADVAIKAMQRVHTPNDEMLQLSMGSIALVGEHARLGTPTFIHEAQGWLICLAAHSLVLYQAISGLILAASVGGSEWDIQSAQAARLLEEGPLWGGHRVGADGKSARESFGTRLHDEIVALEARRLGGATPRDPDADNHGHNTEG